MHDVDMFQFIEKGMRGGVSYIANRHGKANYNKYMKNYNKSAPSKYITYLDANNLYGWAMSQCLPSGGFKWLTEKQINKLKIKTIPHDGNKGFILEVDLQCPKSLHDAHNDYPLAPEQVKVTYYCKQIKDKFNISVGDVHKLILTLSTKRTTSYITETFSYTSH